MITMFKHLKGCFILIIVTLGLVGQAWAQTTTLMNEQAKLVSKFSKDINWPVNDRETKFIIGIYKDNEQYNFFKTFFKNKSVKEKDVLVRLITNYNDAKGINILYLPASQGNTIASANNAIGNSTVLIITEDSNEPHKTMINISYDKQDSQLTFRVNDDKISRSQLTIPNLPDLLDNQKNNESLPLSSTFIKQSQQTKQKLAFQQTIAKQEASLALLNEKLALSNENSELYNLNLQKETARLKVAQQNITKKHQELKSKNKELQRLENELKIQHEINNKATNEQAIDKSVTSLSKEDKTQEEQEQQLAQEAAITELTESIAQQKEITKNTKIKLANITQDNKVLSSFKVLFYIFAIIALIALVIAFLMWKKSKDIIAPAPLQSNKESESLLPLRNSQLVKSENIAALGYIATDTTYAIALALEEVQAQLKSAGDTTNSTKLKPIITLLDNLNLIAADQDDTQIQSFDIVAYIEKMMMLYHFEFNQSDVEYTYSGEKNLTVKSVPSYIALILLNIVNNSLKHGFNNNGNGKVSLHVEKGAKGGIKITYADDGKGMNKATLEQVFEAFFTTQSARGYVGVGMSTTYDLINNKLSGDIKIQSSEGKGTTVIITLP